MIWLVYVAAPYRSPTALGVLANVAWATGVSHDIMRRCPDALAVVPQLNSAFCDELRPEAWWLDATLELMRRCDAVLVGGAETEGVRGEIAEAQRLGIPVFGSLDELAEWSAKHWEKR